MRRNCCIRILLLTTLSLSPFASWKRYFLFLYMSLANDDEDPLVIIVRWMKIYYVYINSSTYLYKFINIPLPPNKLHTCVLSFPLAPRRGRASRRSGFSFTFVIATLEYNIMKFTHCDQQKDRWMKTVRNRLCERDKSIEIFRSPKVGFQFSIASDSVIEVAAGSSS